jgi:hypothetical protein
MHGSRNILCTFLLAAATLLAAAPAARAQVPLGAAAAFAILGGTNVTCTNGSVVTEDVGVSPGSAVPYTDTGCTITGATPPATDAAAALARPAFLSAYAALLAESTACIPMPGSLGGASLAPGVYCIDAVAKAGTLTLNGPSGGVWVFLVNGALTGTNFSVVMTGGGLPCNVFWAPSAAATMTTSAFKGNILAGDLVNGSITLTGGTLAGRALAAVAVTMTGTSVVGCATLAGPPACKGEGDHDHDHDKDKDKDKDGDHKYGQDNGGDGHDQQGGYK